MLNAVTVLKVGGNDVERADWVASLAAVVAASVEPVVIVHGGGREITALQRRLGAEPEWRDGLRVTTPAALAATAMVLNGVVNKRLVAALQRAGATALGVCGIDGGLIRAVRAAGGALGRTGAVERVNADVLRALLVSGFVPVVSPVSMGTDGEPLNVNADEAAGAVAVALGARRLLFVSDVAGVRVGNGTLPLLAADAAEALIAAGTIGGGMIPKVRAAVHALHDGVADVRIGALELTAGGAGTRVVAAAAEAVA